MQDNFNSDWKLFRNKVAGWQEAYMTKLNQEYIELLSSDENASEKFGNLEQRIKKDKRSVGVQINMSRSEMEMNILELLHDGVISLDDLNEFSDELKERISFLVNRNF